MLDRDIRDTRIIDEGFGKKPALDSSELLRIIYGALREKGYDPVQQIAFYLLTGEPAYITAYRNARALCTQVERDEVIEELVRFYVENHPSMKTP